MKFMKRFILAVVFMAAGLVAGIVIQERFPHAVSTFRPAKGKDTSKKEMAGMDMPDQATLNEGAGQKKDDSKPSSPRKILFYRNPMNPSITSPVPAKDSMGMDYVPVYADSAGSGGPPGTVKIDAVVEQNMGVRTGIAIIRKMSRTVHTYGRVTYDEKRIYSIHPRFSGWLTDVAVSRQGDFIKRGQLLARIYSPELVSTQQDYLIALEGMRRMKSVSDIDPDLGSLAENSHRLLAAARRRLELFGIPSSAIRRLEREGKIQESLDVISEVNGTVTRIKAVDGLRVTPATELYGVADLSEVWILADIYETDFPWIKQGDAVQVRSAALPGKSLKGSIDFIYPYENRGKRTVQARIRAENPEGLLRPGMFEPRDVVTGIESEGFTEIRQGLRHGESVVLSGQFLIDSESKLREATLKMIEGSKPDRKEKGEKKDQREDHL